MEVVWNEDDFDKDTGVLKNQRILAESVEITSTANEIHRDGIMNMQHYQMNGMNLDNDNLMVFGNKVNVENLHIHIILNSFFVLIV